MKYSLLGQTGVRVSRIALGTATFGVAPAAEDADRIVGAALDLGINFVDTADDQVEMSLRRLRTDYILGVRNPGERRGEAGGVRRQCCSVRIR